MTTTTLPPAATAPATDVDALAGLDFSPVLPCELHPMVAPASSVPAATVQVTTSSSCSCGQFGTFWLACGPCLARITGPRTRVSHAPCGWWERGTRWVVTVRPLDVGDRCGR